MVSSRKNLRKEAKEATLVVITVLLTTCFSTFMLAEAQTPTAKLTVDDSANESCKGATTIVDSKTGKKRKCVKGESDGKQECVYGKACTNGNKLVKGTCSDVHKCNASHYKKSKEGDWLPVGSEGRAPGKQTTPSVSLTSPPAAAPSPQTPVHGYQQLQSELADAEEQLQQSSAQMPREEFDALVAHRDDIEQQLEALAEVDVPEERPPGTFVPSPTVATPAYQAFLAENGRPPVDQLELNDYVEANPGIMSGETPHFGETFDESNLPPARDPDESEPGPVEPPARPGMSWGQVIFCGITLGFVCVTPSPAATIVSGVDVPGSDVPSPPGSGSDPSQGGAAPPIGGGPSPGGAPSLPPSGTGPPTISGAPAPSLPPAGSGSGPAPAAGFPGSSPGQHYPPAISAPPGAASAAPASPAPNNPSQNIFFSIGPGAPSLSPPVTPAAPTALGAPIPGLPVIYTTLLTCPPERPCANIPNLPLPQMLATSSSTQLLASQPPPIETPSGTYVCFDIASSLLITSGVKTANCVEVASLPRTLPQPTMSDLLLELEASHKEIEPIASLISHGAVERGQRATLTWASVGAELCAVYDDAGNQIAVGAADGSAVTVPLQRTTTFTVSCSIGNGSSVSGKTTVVVQ